MHVRSVMSEEIPQVAYGVPVWSHSGNLIER